MSDAQVDTSVIIRFLTGDDPDKQRRSQALFERVERGELRITAPDTVIADAVFVLSSPRHYRLDRQRVAALLLPLVRLQHFRIRNRRIVLAALELYGATPHLDFGDAMIAAAALQAATGDVYSYDEDFDRLAGITRLEP